MEQVIQCRFKGDRDYLHGTDILNQTLSWVSSAGQWREVIHVDFSFHRLARTQLKACFGGEVGSASPCAVCAFDGDGVRRQVKLFETEEPITDRYPYPEEEMVRQMAIDPDTSTVRYAAECSYTNIEVWVAMTKALHQQIYPHLPGKWLFVRGRFPSYTPHSSIGERAIKIAACFNERLTRSEVLHDGKKVGEIYFAIT